VLTEGLKVRVLPAEQLFLNKIEEEATREGDLNFCDVICDVTVLFCDVISGQSRDSGLGASLHLPLTLHLTSRDV
jgi:hypothetical protein